MVVFQWNSVGNHNHNPCPNPISRLTCERGTKARLSFSGGPHAPVNMTDSVENAGSFDYFVLHGSKITMEVHKNFKDFKNFKIVQNPFLRTPNGYDGRSLRGRGGEKNPPIC